MNEQSPAKVSALMTRRAFVSALAAAGASLAIVPCEMLVAEAMPTGGRREIVSFHMDQPYLDRSGTAVPYHPPCGARSAQIVARLTEEAFRRSCIYA